MDSNPLLLVCGVFCIGPALLLGAGFALGRASYRWRLVRRDAAASAAATGYSAAIRPTDAARASVRKQQPTPAPSPASAQETD